MANKIILKESKNVKKCPSCDSVLLFREVKEKNRTITYYICPNKDYISEWDIEEND